ncbi:hypothetical protein GCM10011390_09170 [Aureimonas endophytica]|uniref:Phosphonate metabolism protein n=1 Tax=Aureimonas endophytica TaxID=2027858 RepID=A0A917E1L6_9HYPH|nr:DUF1045 domain-containing protein [Aureimonas endophytica]GGD92603.1 hypothetical protein GCM10011390_09170 [Aureimonas endophytica]
MRAALYFTPPADAALTRAAALWLGRDAFSGAATRAPDPAIDPLVADPARYGFHATLRAPFRPKDGVTLADLASALDAFAATRRAFDLPKAVIARLDGFLALVPAAPSPDLAALESAILEAFEPFRAPLTADEVARRRPERLSEHQRNLLDRWGYPYVRDEFRFHMTLTNSLAGDALERTETDLRRRLAEFDGAPLAIGGLALFVEEERGAPFTVARLAPFGA